MNISQEGHRQRLRERFQKSGFAGFAPHEIIELLLTYVIPRKDVKGIARILLKRFGSLRGVLDAPREALETVDGIGPSAATFFGFIREIIQGYLQDDFISRDAKVPIQGAELAAFWKNKLQNEVSEHFEVAYLDGNFCLMGDGIERLASGILDRLVVYPRTVLKSVIQRNCHAVVFCHNHPNGSVFPSVEDRELTCFLKQQLEAISVQLVDHFIVGGNQVFSMQKNRIFEDNYSDILAE